MGEAGSKGHFFYNQIGELKKNLNFEINLQNVLLPLPLFPTIPTKEFLSI